MSYRSSSFDGSCRLSRHSQSLPFGSRIPLPNHALGRYKALVFDCYGDWERGIYIALQPLFSQKTCPEPKVVFEHLGQIEAGIQAENKGMLYPYVLELAYQSLAARLRLYYDPDDAKAFARSIGDWPAFADSSAALGRLKALGLKLVILSNVDNKSFSRTRRKLENEWTFDAVYTAEDIGTYKPDLRNFQYALRNLDETFDIQPQEVVCVANSKYHDIIPAHKMGLAAVWIDRQDSIIGIAGQSADADWTFTSMEEFANVMEGVRGMGEVFEE
ncbi:haloacid dehalogenase, type II [Tremella mesenterica]|uniref:Haloacid dehalogenase, type II n=1 Tax=Tremella mesenterica TaxID=5217 RepID=A0A4Q1BFR8_TREME|nr:haloacid dehalogenase, type II [Tremella mesenterica]